MSARYFLPEKGNVLPQFQTDIRIHFCIHQDILQQTDLRIIALPGDHLSSEGLPGNQCTDLPVYLFGIRIILESVLCCYPLFYPVRTILSASYFSLPAR